MALNELIQKTNEIFLKIQSVLERMDQCTITNNYENFCKENHIVNQMLNDAALNCDKLDILTRKEPIVNRSQCKLRVDQFRYDLRHFQSAVRNIETKMMQKNEEMREREMLMNTNFVSNRHPHDDNRTHIVMEHSLEEHKSLSSSVSQMSQLLESGSVILTSLTNQRGTLKAAHKQMLDMLSTLGLSQTVMKMIERRSGQDWLIFCFGCTLILTLLFLLWYYVV